MTSDRRTHSSIEKLPSAIRDAITRMIVDNEWPSDFPKERAFGFSKEKAELTGSPRYEDVVSYCILKGHAVSRSAIGRFGMRMRIIARMKNAGVVVRDVMKDLTAENASATQKAVSEMITAQTIAFIADNDSLSAKEIQHIAQAMKDCTVVAINADKYIRSQIKEKAKAADEKITEIVRKKNIDPETLKLIKEQIYGIIS